VRVRRLRREAGREPWQLVIDAETVMGESARDPLKVIAEIPEKIGAGIRDGQPVELHVRCVSGSTFTGRVSRISPAVNTRRARSVERS